MKVTCHEGKKDGDLFNTIQIDETKDQSNLSDNAKKERKDDSISQEEVIADDMDYEE